MMGRMSVCVEHLVVDSMVLLIVGNKKAPQSRSFEIMGVCLFVLGVTLAERKEAESSKTK